MSDREVRIVLISGQELVFSLDEFDFDADHKNNITYVTSVEGAEQFSHYAINGANIAYVHYNFE